MALNVHIALNTTIYSSRLGGLIGKVISNKTKIVDGRITSAQGAFRQIVILSTI